MSDGIFDRVVVTSAGGRTTELTVAEFFQQPLAERLRCVVERRVQFFAGTAPVDTRDALAQLRVLQAQSVRPPFGHDR